MEQFTYNFELQVVKCDSPIARMTQEEFAFSCHGMPYVLPTLDIFLAPVNNPNVTYTFSIFSE